MANIDPKLGYGVEVINGQTHIYCLQKNGNVTDYALKQGMNKINYCPQGSSNTTTITLNWPGINEKTSFLAVGNPNTTFSVSNLSKIEVKDSNIVYGYIQGGGQTQTTGFEKVLTMFEKVADANGMSNPTIATSGYSGSGPSAYLSTKASNSAKVCILADPCSQRLNYDSGDGVYTLVLTSRSGNDERRILSSNTKNTFIIELNQSIYKIHGKAYDLVSEYGLTDILSGNLDIKEVYSRIRADKYDCKLIYIDENGKIHRSLDLNTAQNYLDKMMTDAEVSSVKSMVITETELSEYAKNFDGSIGGTLASNLSYVSNAMSDLKSQIIAHSDINYIKETSGEASIIGSLYNASNYYGTVTNVLYGNLAAEADAVYDIANAIFHMDNCASMVAETSLSDGVKGLFSTSNSSVSSALNKLSQTTAELYNTAMNAATANGKYNEIRNVLGNTPVAGQVGRISISSIESAIKSIVPNLDNEITKATALKSSVNEFMSGIGSSNILQGETWNNVKTNMESYSSLLDCNVKAATFISDTIKTAMGMISNYIQGASAKINAVGQTSYGSLATIDELDDSKLPELINSIIEMTIKINEQDAFIKAQEARPDVCDTCLSADGKSAGPCNCRRPYSAADMQSWKQTLEKYKEVKGTLDTYKGVLEGFAPVVANAQRMVDDAIEQVNHSYSSPVKDTKGNQTFGSDFSLDLSKYGIDSIDDYKKLVQDCYEQGSLPSSNPSDDTSGTTNITEETNTSDTDTISPDVGSPYSGSPYSGNPGSAGSAPSSQNRTTEPKTEPKHYEIPTMAPTEPIRNNNRVAQVLPATEESKGTIKRMPFITTEPIFGEQPEEVNNTPSVIKLSSRRMNTTPNNVNVSPLNPNEDLVVEKADIIMIDDSGDYSENLVQMSNDFDTPAYIPQTPKPQKSSLRTMGVSSGVGVALGAAALGAYSILKNKDEKDEEEEDFGYYK